MEISPFVQIRPRVWILLLRPDKNPIKSMKTSLSMPHHGGEDKQLIRYVTRVTWSFRFHQDRLIWLVKSGDIVTTGEGLFMVPFLNIFKF